MLVDKLRTPSLFDNPFRGDPLDSYVETINENVNINVISIEEITPKLKDFLDSRLISIYLGNREIDLSLAKKKLYRFLEQKNDVRQKMGSIAEFFLHLYLGTIEFKQECLFKNLEESSMKKGFDGYYSKGNDEWIMESKSGTINSSRISHKSKATEAYKGLKSLLLGKSLSKSGNKNNPWENAYMHASLGLVNTEDSIVKNMQKFSDEFDNDIYYEIKEFNIVIGSTIFYNGGMFDTSDEIIKKVEPLVKKFESQKLEIVCISKKSLDLFIKYLEDKN